MPAGRFPRFREARARYLGVGLMLLLMVALSGWLLGIWISQPDYQPLSRGADSLRADADTDLLFERAVQHMQRREYEAALQVWHRVLVREPEIPEVKVNMGFTLFELGRLDAARDFFASAIEQAPYQANAYYGFALVSERGGDLESALGAMRSYIHLAGPEEDERFIRRARSALWEWEERLAAAREQGEAQAAGAGPGD